MQTTLRTAKAPHRNRRSTVLILLVIAAVFSITLPAAAAPGKVIDDFFDAYRAGDVDRILSIYAEDATFKDVNQRHEASGRPALREMFERLVAIHKVIDAKVQRRAITGDLVAIEVVYSGTLDCAALGRPDHPDLEYDLPAMLMFEVRDGHIQSQTDYVDFKTFTDTFAFLQPTAN